MNYSFPKNKVVRYITLCVTEICNLNCSYCYEGNKRQMHMNFGTAKKIIDYEFSNVKDYEFLCLDFFGGEPFVAFEVIKFATEYIEKEYKDISHILFATTNGTLIHGEIKAWLEKQSNFICELSLDGTPEMHNINRDNSYDLIDVDFFARQYPEQEIKMTVSQETLAMLAEGVEYCHRKGFKVAANLAFGIDWKEENNKSILEEQLHRLIEFYITNPDIKPCTMLDGSILPASKEIDNDFVRKWCGAGTSMHSYTVDGKLYPCQFFMPMSIGEKKAKEALNLHFTEEILVSEMDPKCKNCEILSICPMCIGSNYASTGNLYLVDDNICQLTKIIMKARSYFRAKQLQLGLLTIGDCEKNALIDAILNIQKMEI